MADEITGLKRRRFTAAPTTVGAGDQPTVLDKTAGAFFLGVAEDPLLEPILDTVGFDDETRATLRGQLKDSTAAQVSEFAGEWLLPIAIGGGVFGAGRVVARKGLQKFGTQAAKEFLGQQVGGLVKRAPASVLAGQAAGGSAAIGTLEGARTFVETGDVAQALQSAGTAAALTLAVEVAFGGVGRFATRRGRVDPEAVEAAAQPAVRRIGEDVANLRRQESSIRERIRVALGTDDQAQTLQQAVRRDLGPLEEAISPGAVSEEVAARLLNVRPLRQELRAAKTARRALEKAVDFDPANSYLREGALDLTEASLTLRNVASQLAEAPESLGRKLGVVGTNLVRRVGNAESELQAVLIHNKSTVFKAQKDIAESLGEKSLTNSRWLDLFEVWEDAGEDGIRAAFAAAGRSGDDVTRALGAFKEVDTMLQVPARQLERMGGPTAITAQELSQAGLAKYIPKRMLNVGDDILDERLAEFGLDEARQAAVKNLTRSDLAEEGTRKFFGIPEFQGSLNSAVKKFSQKGRSKLLVDDPWEAVLAESLGTHKRIIYGRFMGVSPRPATPRGGPAGTGLKTSLQVDPERQIGALADDVLDGNSVESVRSRIVAASQAEGGSKALVNTLIDSVHQTKYHNGAMSALANIATSIQIPAKMTFSVITNMSGSVQTGLKFGYANATKQLFKGLRGEADLDFLRTAGVYDDMTHHLMDMYRMDAAAKNTGNAALDGIGNAASTAARWILDKTGFSAVERWNRVIAANAGLEFFRKTATQAAAGRLKGATLAARRRAFKDIGVDLDDFVQRWPSLTADQVAEIERRVAYNSMKITQFAPGPTTRPNYWNTPVGRVMTQYKSFAFNQARFMRDAVFSEAANGNVAPLATFLAVYPVAGEFVRDAKALTKLEGREDSGVQRYVNNVLAVGGLGLASDVVMNARFGGEKLLASIMGPTISDVSNLGAAALTVSPERLGTFVTRQPAIQALDSFLKLNVLGWQAATEAIDSGFLDQQEGPSGPEVTPVRLEDFQSGSRSRRF